MARPLKSAAAGAGAWLLLALLWLSAGCATTGADSDIPWNTPQPWETAPSIPGLNH